MVMNNLIEQSDGPVIFDNDFLGFISSQAGFVEKLLGESGASGIVEEAGPGTNPNPNPKDCDLVIMPELPPVSGPTHRRDFSEMEVAELFKEMLPTHLKEEFAAEFEVVGDILTVKGFQIFKEKVDGLLESSEFLLGMQKELDGEFPSEDNTDCFIQKQNLQESDQKPRQLRRVSDKTYGQPDQNFPGPALTDVDDSKSENVINTSSPIDEFKAMMNQEQADNDHLDGDRGSGGRNGDGTPQDGDFVQWNQPSSDIE